MPIPIRAQLDQLLLDSLLCTCAVVAYPGRKPACDRWKILYKLVHDFFLYLLEEEIIYKFHTNWIFITCLFLLEYKCYWRSNQIFHYTRCKTPKRVTSWRGPSPRHCARATQLLSKKCCSGGEPLATLCPIWPARDLNLRPPASETNALPLDQLAGLVTFWFGYYLIWLLKINEEIGFTHWNCLQ